MIVVIYTTYYIFGNYETGYIKTETIIKGKPHVHNPYHTIYPHYFRAIHYFAQTNVEF